MFFNSNTSIVVIDDPSCWFKKVTQHLIFCVYTFAPLFLTCTYTTRIVVLEENTLCDNEDVEDALVGAFYSILVVHV